MMNNGKGKPVGMGVSGGAPASNRDRACAVIGKSEGDR